MKQFAYGIAVFFFVKKVEEIISQKAGCRGEDLGIKIIALIFTKPEELFAFLEADFDGPTFCVLFDDRRCMEPGIS